MSTGTFADKLIGMQIVSWDNNEKTLTVKKGEEQIKLVFDDSDEGDCCGYNNFFVDLYVTDEELKRNPAIVKCEVEYSEKDWECEQLKLTFIGEAKKLMTIDSCSGSASGFCYGAVVTVKCKALDIDECVTSW